MAPPVVIDLTPAVRVGREKSQLPWGKNLLLGWVRRLPAFARLSLFLGLLGLVREAKEGDRLKAGQHRARVWSVGRL